MDGGLRLYIPLTQEIDFDQTPHSKLNIVELYIISLIISYQVHVIKNTLKSA